MKKKILVLILVLGIFILPLFVVGVKTNAWTNVDDSVFVSSTRYDAFSVIFSSNGTTSPGNNAYTLIKLKGYTSIDSNEAYEIWIQLKSYNSDNVLAFCNKYNTGWQYFDVSLNAPIIMDTYTYSDITYDYFEISSVTPDYLSYFPNVSIEALENYDPSNPVSTGILQALTEPISTLGVAILGALVSYFDVLVIDGSGISNITTFMFVILSISLVIGMTRWIVSLIRRKI